MGGNLEDFFISHKRCKEQVILRRMVERLLGRKERREKIIFYHSPHTFFIMRKEVVFKFFLRI